MTIQEYQPENLKDIQFPFTIDIIKSKYMTNVVKLDNLLLNFQDSTKYRYFWYCMKKSQDYNITPQSVKSNMSDLDQYTFFDSAMNVVKTFSYKEKVNNNQRDYYRFIDEYKKNFSETVAGGIILDDFKIDIKDGDIVDYKNIKTDIYSNKVIGRYMDKSYDETFEVFIESKKWKNYSLGVLYCFEKSGDNLWMIDIHSDYWTY